MKLEIFSMRDVKAGSFGAPMHFVNRAVAIRSLSEAVKNPESTLSKFPEDYQLFHVGDFDQNSGVVEALDAPNFVINVSDLKVA